MFRHLALAALVAAVALPPAPAPAAQDDLVRQLIDQCVGCRFPKDLHGRDLHGLRFVGADLRDADFSHANLNGAQFTGSDLAGARFDDADLRNARFVGVEFRGTSFARAKVDGVTMRGVRLGPGSIVGADYKRFLRDCGGCDVADLPVMPPEFERSMRELEQTMREHPPVIPRDLIERSMRDAERSLRNAERGVRERRPAVPAVPPLAPLPPLPVVPPAPSAPPAPARR